MMGVMGGGGGTKYVPHVFNCKARKKWTIKINGHFSKKKKKEKGMSLSLP